MTDYAKLASQFGGAVESASPLDVALNEEGISGEVADIARSIYQQESGSGKNTKTSNAGARGGMQIIPATFNRMADKGWAIDDPVHNARAGVRYVNQLYNKAGGDPALTAAGYYGGEGAINKAKKGIAVSDPRNPNAPNTLQYGAQVAARLPKKEIDYSAMASKFGGALEESPSQLDQSKEYTAPELLAMREQGVNIGDARLQQRTFKDDLQAEIDANPLSADFAAFGAPLSNGYEGARQLSSGVEFNKASPARGAYGRAIDYNQNGNKQAVGAENQQQIDANAQFAENSPIASLGGNVAMYAAGGIAAPALNTARGAAGLAGGIGFLNPVDADNTQDMLRQKAGNALLDASFAGGTTKGVLAIGNKVLQRQAAKSLAKANANTDLAEIAINRYGIPLDRASTSDSKMLKATKSVLDDILPFGAGAKQKELIKSTFNKKVGEVAGIDAEPVTGGGLRLTADAVSKAKQKIGTAYDKVWGQNKFSVDRKFANDATDLIQEASTKLNPEQASMLNRHFDNLIAQSKDGKIDGAFVNNWQSELRQMADSEQGMHKKFINDLRQTTLSAFKRNISKQDADLLTKTNIKNRAFKTIEPLLNKGEAGVAGRDAGDIPPSLFSSAIASNYKNAAQSPFGELPRIGSNYLADRVARTGGSERGLIQQALALGGLGAGAGFVGGAPAAAVGIPAAYATQKLLSMPRKISPNYNIGKVDYLTKLLKNNPKLQDISRNSTVAIGAGAAPALAQQFGF